MSDRGDSENEASKTGEGRGFPTKLAIGFLLIAAAVGMFALTGPPRGSSNFERGQAFGRGIVQLAAVVVGLVLVVLHFVRRRR